MFEFLTTRWLSQRGGPPDFDVRFVFVHPQLARNRANPFRFMDWLFGSVLRSHVD